MPIYLIDKIAPQGGAFTGMVDYDQVIGLSGFVSSMVSGVVPSGSVTQTDLASVSGAIVSGILASGYINIVTTASGDTRWSGDGTAGNPLGYNTTDFLTGVARDDTLTGNGIVGYELGVTYRLPVENIAISKYTGIHHVPSTYDNTLQLWDVCYIGSDNKYHKACAGSGKFISPVVVINCTPNGGLASGMVALNTGFVYDTTAFSGVVGGDLIYLSPTVSGAITKIRPSGSGEVVQILGYGFDNNIVYFNPQYTYIELN